MTDSTAARESRLRSLCKAVTYRILGTLTTMAVAFGVTGQVSSALAIGAIEPIVKMLVYYAHERAWQQVPIGTIRQLAHRVTGTRPAGDAPDD